MAGTPNHNTLELNHRRSDKDTSGMEVDPCQPDGTSDIEVRPRQPDYTPGTEVNEQQLYNDVSIPEVYHYNNLEVWRPEGHGDELSSAPQSNQEDLNPKASGKKILFGVSRRISITRLIVSLVIIGAIAGGVAGGLRNRRGTATNATNSILKVSKLAAANRTMPSGPSYRTVVFQDGSGALLSRRRPVSSPTWSTTNITRDFENRTNQVVIPNGTPLAAMGCQDWECGETSVFYLGTNGLIHGLIDGTSLGHATWTYLPAISNANLYAWAKVLGYCNSNGWFPLPNCE